MIRPIYTLRDLIPRHLVSGTDSSKWWTVADPSVLGSGLRFTMGLGASPPGASCPIYPDAPTTGPFARAYMILKGVALARAERIEEKLSAYDCVYAPIGSVCSLKNIGTEDLYFLWMGSSKVDQSNLRGDSGVKVVHTVRDLEAEEEISPGGKYALRRPIDRSLTGSGAFDLSLVMRPAGWSGTLHGHVPPDAQEVFMALDGQLTSIDDADTRCVLGTYDCVYIPPHARHQNSNASD